MAKQAGILPIEVAKVFKLAPDAPVVFFEPPYGDIDFRSISEIDAQKLVDANCPYLSKIETESSETAG